MFRFLLLIFLSGCATSTYTTKHNIEVFDYTTINKPSQVEVETITEYVCDRLQVSVEKVDGISLMLINKWIKVPRYKSPDHDVADGHTNIWDEEVIVSVFQTCLADSGLPHELAHVVHDIGKVAPDWWHDDKEFWNVTVKQMEHDIIKDLCDANHVHVDIPEDYTPPK